MGEHISYGQGVIPPKPEAEALPLSREDKIKARVTELCDANTRRSLEEIARGLGIEPARTEYPDKETLARAIAEKEFPPEVETEEP
jgi:hypothetical protein